MSVVPFNPEPEAPLASEPPHSEESEQALLGALLTNNEVYARVAEFLKPEHFYDPLHAAIYAAIQEKLAAGMLATPITLKAQFPDDLQYMGRLSLSVVTIINAWHYGRTILEYWQRREGLRLVAELSAALNGPDDATKALEDTQAALYEVQNAGRQNGKKGMTSAEAGRAALERFEAVYRNRRQDGVSTGFPVLDGTVGALVPARLYILAARPSMGKSSLLRGMAIRMARAGHPVFISSMEMSAEAIAAQNQSGVSGVWSDKIAGKLPANQLDWELVYEAQAELDMLPIFIDDSAALTPPQLRAKMRNFLSRAHRLPGAKAGAAPVSLVDFLQLMRTARARGTDTETVTEIARELQAISKDLEIPLVALSQLSRNVESRDDKRPTLADLRQSGAIEEAADVVMFLYREAYYVDRQQPQKKAEESDEKFDQRHSTWAHHRMKVAEQAEIIVAKNRFGRTGDCLLRFKAATTWFEDWVR